MSTPVNNSVRTMPRANKSAWIDFLTFSLGRYLYVFEEVGSMYSSNGGSRKTLKSGFSGEVVVS